jgi:thioredoxin-like negative regulator of GroEL
MIARGELSQAEKTLRGALNLCLDYPDTTLATSEIADSLAIALWRQGKLDEVEGLLRMALQPRPGKPFEVTTALPHLIDFLLAQGKTEAAEGVFQNLLAQCKGRSPRGCLPASAAWWVVRAAEKLERGPEGPAAGHGI